MNLKTIPMQAVYKATTIDEVAQGDSDGSNGVLTQDHNVLVLFV